MACPTQALLSLWTPQHLVFRCVVTTPEASLADQPQLVLRHTVPQGNATRSTQGPYTKFQVSCHLGSGRRGKNIKPGLAPRCHTTTPGDTVLMLPYAEPSKVFVSLLSGYYRPAHSKISPLRSGGSATSATTLPVIKRTLTKHSHFFHSV